MKLIISWLTSLLLALSVSVSGQLYIGSEGMFVTNGSDFSYEGLQFVANGDHLITNDVFTLSYTPITGTIGNSIAKVIQLSVPWTFNGTFNLLYTDAQLNGNAESLLKFAVRPASGWATMPASTTDAVTNIVQHVTGTNITTDRFTATVVNNVLPLVKYSFSAGVTSSNVQLQWLVDENDFYKGFQLEESENGSSWTTVTYITALSASKQMYSYNDANLNTDKKFYRLRLDPKIGQSTYSEVLTVTNAMKTRKALIITDKNLLAINFLQGSVPDEVLLIDNAGKTIYRAQQKQSHYLINNLKTGIYIVRYQLQGKSYIEKVMVK